MRHEFADLGAALAVTFELPRGAKQVAGLGSLQLGLGKGERLAIASGEGRFGIKEIHVGGTSDMKRKMMRLARAA